MPGEWIDELGSLLMYFPDDPQVAVDLFRTPTGKRETFELARAMMSSDMEPYPGESMPGVNTPPEVEDDGLL